MPPSGSGRRCRWGYRFCFARTLRSSRGPLPSPSAFRASPLRRERRRRAPVRRVHERAAAAAPTGRHDRRRSASRAISASRTAPSCPTCCCSPATRSIRPAGPQPEDALRDRPVLRRQPAARRRARWWCMWSRTRSSIASPSRATTSSTTTRCSGELQLRPRAVFTPALAQSDRQHILDLYARRGRFAARGGAEDHQARRRTASTWSSRSARATITLVSRIAFVGNHAFSEERLKEVINSARRRGGASCRRATPTTRSG